MKALLVVGSQNSARANLEWTGIIFLPIGDPGADPHFVVSFDDNEGIRFDLITNEELAELRIAKEVDLSEEVVNSWRAAYDAKDEWQKKEKEFKQVLLKEKVDWSCNALSFLSYGSTLL